MEKRLRNEIKNFDMSKMDVSAFGESLLQCATKAKEICAGIDANVSRMATIAFIPYVSAAEQYDNIIEDICVKKDIIVLHKALANWYEGLGSKQRQLYKAYFTVENGKIHNHAMKNKHFFKKVILPMIRSFMFNVKVMFDFDEKELIHNPHIYRTYSAIARRNSKQKKGGTKHDNPTNERCDCGCVQN